MASANNSTTLRSNGNHAYTLQAYFNEESTNISNNSSRIYVEAKLTSTGYRWTSSYNSYLRIYWHDNRENYDRLIGEVVSTSITNGGSITASGVIDPLFHNDDGSLSGYAYATWTKGGTSSYTPNSGSVTTSLTSLTQINRYPVITSVQNFTDEQNPTMYFTSYGTFPIRCKIEAGGNPTLITRDLSSSSTSCTFSLTDEERNKLRALCPNSNTLATRFTVCAMSGNTELSVSYKDYTMTVVNSNPEFSYFEFEDVNEKTTNLTGNLKSIIKGFSTVLITVPTDNKATAKKYATISKYRGKIGELIVDIPYSIDSRVSGRINNASSSTITCYAIDSRNNSTSVEKQAVNFINYSPVTKGNIFVNRENGVSENVRLKINGTYHNVNFGTVTNSIKTAQYRYKTKENTGWSEYYDIEITTEENGNFSFDGLIKGDTDTLGFNINNSYMFEVLIEDELSGVTFTANLGSGIPNIALDKNGVGIMGKYDESVGGKFQVGGKCYDKNIMTIFSTARFDTSGTDRKLTGLTSNTSTGDKLIYTNSSIKIGKGITKILVSATVSYWYSNYYWQSRLEIRKNDSIVLARIWFESSNDQYTTCGVNVSPCLADVKEGDVISLYFCQGESQQITILGDTNSTFLTVEAIE